MLLGGDAALYFRRGHSHGILAMIVLPLLLAGSVWLWHRWRSGGHSAMSPPFRFGWIIVLAFLAVWSHPLLDWLNTYGVRFLMPFDGSWYYGDTLFIIDPWLWLLAAAAVVLARSHSKSTLSAWLVLLAISSGLVLGTGIVSDSVKLLWIIGVSIILLLRLRSNYAQLAVPVARGGLLLLVLYIGVAFALARVAESTLREQFPAASVAQANPVPGTPRAHRVLLVEPELYRIVYPDGETQELSRKAENAIVAQALASPELRGFSNWMRFPYWEIEEGAGAWTVSIWDLRYQAPGQQAVSGIGYVQLELPKQTD